VGGACVAPTIALENGATEADRKKRSRRCIQKPAPGEEQETPVTSLAPPAPLAGVPNALAPSLEQEVALAVAHDEAARARLLKAIAPVIARQLARFRLSPEDQRDVVQNTLLRVHQRLGDYRGDARFTTWLFRLTANEALMYLRADRRRRAHFVYDEAEFEGVAASLRQETEVESPVDEVAIRNLVAALPSDYQYVLTARYAENRPLQQIADTLDTSRACVRSRLHRARATLRGRLEEAGFASLPALLSA
jgi:RNA polymerase sigma-70 factor, ECF subfamily